jgi:2,6-dihydroxypyridine 3-monooxygenase
MSQTGPRVAVMGGSLGGLNAALWLREAGCDVEVYERSNTPLSGQGTGIVLNPATVRYFTERNILDLEEISVQSEWVRYVDRNGSVADQQPASYLFSSYNALYRSFLNCFGEDSYHLGTAVAAFEQDDDEVTVRLANGESKLCDLLVCADGIRSTARERLFPEVSLQYAGYIAWRGSVAEEDMSPQAYAELRDAITYHVMPNSHMLAYPIPMVGRSRESESPYINWLWYRNMQEGPELEDLMTDRNGLQRDASLAPGTVQERHLKALRAAAERTLPPLLQETLLTTKEPFVQVILDAGVHRLAFGRVCLIGDAAFAARPHAAAGTAKAAEDGRKLAEAVGRKNGDVVGALKAWEPGQLELGRKVLFRTREAGTRSQFDSTWRIGDPLPFGLYKTGDSSMTLA